MSAEIYERQQEWKDHTRRKYDKARQERAAQQSDGLTFEPHIFTSEHIRAGLGSATLRDNDCLLASSRSHVQRQRGGRARREAHGIAAGREDIAPPPGANAPELPRGERAELGVGRSPFLAEDGSLRAGLAGSAPEAEAGDEPEWLRDAVPFGDYDDESFYEQLQRERREWSKERERLLRVVELQQIELSKRSAAVTQQAATIASSFAESVVTFEDRLVQLESSVASELRMLRQRGGGLGGSSKS